MRPVLTALDDTLQHQITAPFAQVASTDHRFFDRQLYTSIAPDGSLTFITGIAAYPVMNVFDGYFAAVAERHHQHNVRVSRVLRPSIDRMGAGPLSVTNLVPHQRNKVTLSANPGPVTADVVFEAAEAPRLELPHRTYVDGQLVEEYLRANQNGTISGTITVGDRVWQADRWYAMKDHSWGARDHFGGVTLHRGGVHIGEHSGLFLWTTFTSGPYDGYVQVKQAGDSDRRFIDGEVRVTDERGASHTEAVVAVEHNIEFVGLSNIVRRVALTLDMTSGRQYEVVSEPSTLATALIGTGYYDGFSDRRGLGTYRGDDVVETDRYELFDDGWVKFPNGRRGMPWDREQCAPVSCDGEPGFGYVMVVAEGWVERYGRTFPERSRQGNGITWEDGAHDVGAGRAQGDAAAAPADQAPRYTDPWAP